MKKYLLSLMSFCCFATFVTAQESVIGDPNPETVGNDSAAQALREVSLEKFEREGSWTAHISPDVGIVSTRLFDGSPAMKEPVKGEEDSGVVDEKVFGVKVEFYKRGINSIHIMAQRPIAVEGIAKTISVWICGRNQDHSLYVLVQDMFGRKYQIYMGDLGFTGWKKLTAVVPPSLDGETGIVQNSPFYINRPGMRILGFRVDCNPMLARGTYYMYLDDMRSVTDLYDVEKKDADDMSDNW